MTAPTVDPMDDAPEAPDTSEAEAPRDLLTLPEPEAAKRADRLWAALEALKVLAAGAARHLPESALSAERIDAEVRGLLADPAARRAMSAAARQRGRPTAAADIARHIAQRLDRPAV